MSNEAINMPTGERPAYQVGCPPYLNVQPLIHEFESVWPEATLRPAVPFDLAHLLDEGELDMALLSTIHQLHASYRSVPHLGVVSHGPVRSVLLHSKVPLEEIETVALLQDSLSSSVLTKIVLEEFYERRPKYRAYHLPVEQGLFLGEAVLTIGDVKYFVDHPAEYVFDLGEEWQKGTGLPFVYARWLVADHVDLNVVTPLLLEIKKRGCAAVEEIANRWPSEDGVKVEFMQRYLTENITYDVGPRELEGIEKYFNLAERVSRRAVEASTRAR